MIQRFVIIPTVIAVLALAACSGGGRHVPKVSPTATPTAGGGGGGLASINTLPAMSPGGGHGGGGSGMSAYSLDSSPQGIAWQRIDPTGTNVGAATATGVTPATETPPSAPHVWQYVFGGQNRLPQYSVTIAQVKDGAHQVFYAAGEDSQGSVDTSQLRSIARFAASRSSTGARMPADAVRRPVNRAQPAAIEEGRVYVRYRRSALARANRAPSDIESSARTSGYDVIAFDDVIGRVVRVPSGQSAAEFAQRLQSSDAVVSVDPIHKRYLLERTALTANDPHFNNVDQWYLFADGFPNAWAYTNGARAKIAVVDTGVELSNVDLAAKIDYKKQIYVQNGSLITSDSPEDQNGHGTNVAAIAGAGTNDGLGFAGSGRDVRLMIYGIFAPNAATAGTTEEAQAIRDAVDHGADVINLSLGAGESYSGQDGYDQAEHDAVQYALSHNVTVVAAAGNNADGADPTGDGFMHSTLDYPAAYPGVIGVGASALKNDNGAFSQGTEYVAGYSQSAPTLSVVAPGGDPAGNDNDPLHWIWNYSAPAGGCKTPTPATSCTEFFAGTSQATPQVTAAAALLISFAGGNRALTPAQVMQVLQSTADDIGDPRQGHGRLNAYRALASISGDTATTTGPRATTHSTAQLIAFAYNNSGSNKPVILDYNYPAGVPVATDGTFRIADVRPQDATSYKVAVWFDGNGDGTIDVGDQIGVAPVNCTTSSVCAIGKIVLQPVASAAYVLP